jgi:hypothetical protein
MKEFPESVYLVSVPRRYELREFELTKGSLRMGHQFDVLRISFHSRYMVDAGDEDE